MDAYEQEILRLRAEGKTHRDISSWLLTKGLQVSHVTVGHWLNKKKAERSEEAKKAIAQEVPKIVTTDLERLDTIYQELGDSAEEAKDNCNFTGYAKMKELQIRIVALRFAQVGLSEERSKGEGPFVVLPQGLSLEQWNKLWKLGKK